MNAAETYILFELAGAAYGVRSRDVLHIDMVDHITPVPNAAAAVDGVVFSRGQVIPALNLRARFGFPREAPSPRTRLIFMKCGDRTVALVVDSAREFRSIPTDSIRPIESTLTGINSNYVRGVATVHDRLVLLLDVAAVLQLDRAELAATLPQLQPTA
ncbi:MAG TPA: chemotaxis protein CheW [Opitutaceae bacterium]|nr:chemotaxis protein CheW [Opitutaceae bacterium]